MSMGLTPRMAQCLAIMREGVAQTGRVPSYRKIADQMKLRSAANIHAIVDALVERGHVQRAGAVQLTPKAFEQPGVQS